jgi:hypothetical protein
MTAAPLPRPRGPGRPPCCPPELAARIIDLHRSGLSYGQICIILNAKQVPTPMGCPRWLKSHVARLLHTRYAQSIIESYEDDL